MEDFRCNAQEYDPASTIASLRSVMRNLVQMDWKQAMIARGMGWHADVGAFLTGIVGGGAGTIIDQDRPELTASVPAGFCMVPLRIEINLYPPLIAADSDHTDILIAVDTLAKQDGTGTATAETPANMRSDITAACPLVIRSAYTANATNPTLSRELARSLTNAEIAGAAANSILYAHKLVYEPLNPQLIMGPACLCAYFGGTAATTGYLCADFLAFPASLLNTLS